MADAPAAYTFPNIYHFPPFFTLQPADATRAKQLAAWRSIVVGWHHAHRRALMDVRGWPHWENRALGRRLAPEGVSAVLAHMVSAGSGEWADEARTQCRILFRSPAEYAALLRGAARGLQGVQTLWQLCAPGGEGQLEDTEFDGMDPELMLRVLELLEAEGHVDLFRSADDGAEVPTAQVGVRFK